ncbi:hypothetical protein [Alicyclobacillus fodiniaquatilis]|uniref:Uncharacterized protein n=1 Tax=Alicyclobacillus fodiniaquatilis TaxID=1661150 RepID=A0ABW4JEU4_9BACL
MQRQKTTLRLDPAIVGLGRKLAKTDYGSETKLGLLIEQAIRAYHARQLTELEASGLISATERALVERLEKRFDEMSQRTVERVGNLIAKSSYETSYSTAIIEDIFTGTYSDKRRARNELETLRKEASQRMRKRFDQEEAEQVASLIVEHENVLEENKALQARVNELAERVNQANVQVKQADAISTELRNRLRAREQEHSEERAQSAQLEAWTRGLMRYIRENVGRMKTGEQGIAEYIQNHPAPKGL